MGIRNESFMKLAAVGTWMGDFVTAWMVRNFNFTHFKCQMEDMLIMLYTLFFFLNQSPHELFYFMLYFKKHSKVKKEGSCFHG